MVTATSFVPWELLTERQRLLLTTYVKLMAWTGTAPTIRELMREMGIGSPNGVACHYKALVRDGWIEPGTRTARALLLTDGAMDHFRGVKVVSDGVRLTVLVPVVTLTPQEARELGLALLRAAEGT